MHRFPRLIRLWQLRMMTLIIKLNTARDWQLGGAQHLCQGQRLAGDLSQRSAGHLAAPCSSTAPGRGDGAGGRVAFRHASE